MPLTNGETSGAGTDRPAWSRAMIVLVGCTPVLLGALHGGYFASVWLTLGMIAPAVFLMLRVAGGAHDPWFRFALPWPAVAAIACLGLFASWNVLSAVWATDAAAALLEGTRAFLYLFTAVATLTVVRDNRDARLLLSSFALASAIVALVTVFGMASSSSPENYFRFFKLNEPVGYYNAEATFFTVPALVAIHLASRKSTQPLLRPLLFAAGIALLETAVLTQSRGGFWALAAAVVVYLILLPGRPRALLWWAVALAIVVLAFPRLNAPHIDLREHDFEALLLSGRGAAAAVAASLAAALALAGALVAVDARLIVGRRGTAAGRAAAVALVLIALVLLVSRFPGLTDPAGALDRGWTQFKGTQSSSSDVRILDLSGSRRYELWQVAWRTFEESPATGIGADNYVVAWNRTRPIPHDVRQPHNLYLRLFSELGVPGFALFLAAVVVGAGGGLYGARRRSPHDRALVACLAAACTAFLVHAAGEWVWHVPAVALTFFVMLGLLLGNGPNPRSISRITPLTLTAAIGLAVAVLSVPQLASARLDDRAASLIAQGEPALAQRAAEWSARANPLSGAPYIAMGKAAAATGDVQGAEAAFSTATRKNPADWHTYLLWGDMVRDAGGDAAPQYERAGELNPLSYDVRDRLEQTDPGTD